jgi:ribonuclease Z
MEPDRLTVVEASPGRPVIDSESVIVEPFQLDRGPDRIAFGYLFFERPIPGRVDAEKAHRLGIRGVEFHDLQQGKKVRNVRPQDVIGPARSGRRVVVTGATLPTPGLTEALTNADLAVVAAPYMDERLEVAIENYSMTGWQAAELASTCKTKALIVTRLSGASANAMAFRQELGQFHASAWIARDGDRVTIRLPGAGGAVVRARGARDEVLGALD